MKTRIAQALATVRTARGSREAASYEDAVRYEMESLWHELGEAIDGAIDGVWSIRCDHIVARLTFLMLAFKWHTNWNDIPMRYDLYQLWEKILDELGIEHEPVDYVKVGELMEDRDRR